MQGWRERKATISEDQDHVLNDMIFEGQIICNSTGFHQFIIGQSIDFHKRKKKRMDASAQAFESFFRIFRTNDCKSHGNSVNANYEP